MSEGGDILIVEARFYEDIADELAAGATEVLKAAGRTWRRVEVPGVFEVPAAVNLGWLSGRFEGVITLGCVIRGETDHYDHICRETSRKLMDLAVDHRMAHGFGILTCENRDQAEVRAARSGRNVGGRAAEACIRMLSVDAEFNA